MTRPALPAWVRRQPSWTVRHRLTPAMTFATITRARARRGCRQGAPTLTAWPCGWGGLCGQAAGGLLAWHAGRLGERGMAWGDKRRRIGGFLVVGCAGDRRSQRTDVARVVVPHQPVWLRRRFLLPAVMRRVGVGRLGAWVAARRPLTPPMGGPSSVTGLGATRRASRSGAPSRAAPARCQTGSQ